MFCDLNGLQVRQQSNGTVYLRLWLVHCKRLLTWISDPMTMLGLLVGLPSFFRRFCQLRFIASPPSRMASLQSK